jgi:Zn-ribbon RNA-binding protein
MVKKELKCSSCKRNITNLVGSAKFKCPSCGKQEIIRCKNCREIVATYKCPECGFEGPN